MKICFFGVGGVGGFFGSLVTQRFSKEHQIFFIARGNHKEAICTNGLMVKKEGGKEIILANPDICTDTTADLPTCDLIVLSVKSYDLEEAVQAISGIATTTTMILPLLNGVDIYERIKKQSPPGRILPSCVYIGTHIENPGVIYQNGGNCKICIGKDPVHSGFYPEQLLNLLHESGINCSFEEDIRVPIWSKFMFIASYGLVAATHDKTLGEILENDSLCSKVLTIMEETEKIARKLQIPLPPDIVSASYNKAKQFPYETKTSFQRDVESKRTTHEGDLFGGTLIRYGESLGIPTPGTREIYTTLLQKTDSYT